MIVDALEDEAPDPLRYAYQLSAPEGVNLDGYQVQVTATDLAGNPQADASLCAVETRTGTILGRGPALSGDISLTLSPSVVVDDVPWGAAGSTVTVQIPTTTSIDPQTARVSLSGVELEAVPSQTNTWTLRDVDSAIGEGFKQLDGRLNTTDGPWPSARTDATLVYDPDREVLVLYGGRLRPSNEVTNETWEWDGVSWSVGPPCPDTHVDHAASYDATREAMVVSGGSPNPTKVWAYDGSSWLDITPASDTVSHSLSNQVYDPQRGQILLFADGSTYGLTDAGWRPLTGTPSPPPRFQGEMAYDPLREEVVLFGGTRDIAGNETWAWDGDRWRLAHAGGASAPPPRTAASLAWDSARQQMLLFGGYQNPPARESNDTWVWNGTTWTQRFPTNVPSRRHTHAMADDAGRGVLVMFGGTGPGNLTTDETWEWNGTNWTQRHPTPTPGARDLHMMGYDPVRGEVVMFGGGGPTIPRFNQTWLWDGASWFNANPSPAPPWRDRLSETTTRWPSTRYAARPCSSAATTARRWATPGPCRATRTSDPATTSPSRCPPPASPTPRSSAPPCAGALAAPARPSSATRATASSWSYGTRAGGGSLASPAVAPTLRACSAGRSKPTRA